jgi:hypothetical protein
LRTAKRGPKNARPSRHSLLSIRRAAFKRRPLALCRFVLLVVIRRFAAFERRATPIVLLGKKEPDTQPRHWPAGNLRQAQPDLFVLQLPPKFAAAVRPERGSNANSLHQAHSHAISLIQSPTTCPINRTFSQRPASR